MRVIQIEKKAWEAGIENLRKSHRLLAPAKDGDFHTFKELADGEQPDLHFGNTRISAKSVVYPQSQVLFSYSLDENDKDHHLLKEVSVGDTPTAVIGIRPCDADAFLLVKRNFDTDEYKDPYWIRAYEQTTFVGLACDDPCSTCFCTTAGSGPFSETGLDLLLVDVKDHYLAKPVTEKGSALLAAGGWTAETDADDKMATMKQEAESRIVSKISTDRLTDIETTELYDAPFWEDVAFSCINCGTCTYLCPTCWCFDIQDENHGNAGVRMRNWDSCMAPLFTLHGSGHNPRGTKIQRVRQRFMHKLKYYVDKYGNGIQCVGCGRCIQYCPVNIDIRKVCELMNSSGSSAVVCEAK
jgi:sulfhydrogenase subunit beta (sulfur reductase)